MKKLAALMIAVLIICTISACGDSKIVDYDVYVVQQGDTLWSIASRTNGKDVRDVIEDIKAASHCTSDICIGDILMIPTYEEDN